MSEYQYYEFQALDSPLEESELRQLRNLSTRASITPTSFVNVYHFGDFKGDPRLLMEKFFDAFVYVANWGTRWLMFRLPRNAVDVKSCWTPRKRGEVKDGPFPEEVEDKTNPGGDDKWEYMFDGLGWRVPGGRRPPRRASRSSAGGSSRTSTAPADVQCQHSFRRPGNERRSRPRRRSENYLHMHRTAAVLFLAVITGSCSMDHRRDGGQSLDAEKWEAPWTVTYHDGSGNGFRFWQEAVGDEIGFDYTPVTPEASSSGIYDGGAAKTSQVSAERVNELWRRLHGLELDDSIRAATRVMGSGAFRVSTPGETRDFLIEEGPQLREFEAFLKSFL